MAQQTYQYIFKIMILGEAAVGKTSLVNRFVNSKFDITYKFTIGLDNYVKYIDIDNKSVCLQCWDIGGQKHFKGIHDGFYRGARGALMVFDLTRKNTLFELDEWIKNALEKNPDMEMILVGNKSELEEYRAVTKKEVQAFLKKHAFIGYIETSAKTGSNVNEAFHKIAEEIYKKQV